MNQKKPLLEVENLKVDFQQGNTSVEAVRGVSFDIYAGETLALVGESGSGKSVTAHSILKLLPYPKARHPAGNIRFDGQSLMQANEPALRKVRGNDIAMIFQEPMTALNPLQTVEKQITECFRPAIRDKRQAHQRVINLLQKVRIHDPESKCPAYPHELSGGQRQRVMIAMAIANNPKLLIADEPTTALDVSVQAEILQLLKDLQQEHQLAILLITHDLAVVRHVADRIAVMQHGRIVEQSHSAIFFETPQHAYSRSLLDTKVSERRPLNSSAPVILQIENLAVDYPVGTPFLFQKQKYFHALEQVNFSLRKGESLGIVGESGSGKSTIANALLKLIASNGSISLNGTDIGSLNEKQFRPLRQHLQVVFQDPFASLSPRMVISDIIAEGLRFHQQLSSQAVDEAVTTVMKKVGLDPALRFRYPHEFSGGQRQRIAIARALIMKPQCIILDEPTSALDRSVQYQVLDLLLQLQQEYGLSYIFISHDLKLVKAFCHNVLVLRQGQLVESGTTEQVFESPRSDYTRLLIDACL